MPKVKISNEIAELLQKGIDITELIDIYAHKLARQMPTAKYYILQNSEEIAKITVLEKLGIIDKQTAKTLKQILRELLLAKTLQELDTISKLAILTTKPKTKNKTTITKIYKEIKE